MKEICKKINYLFNKNFVVKYLVMKKVVVVLFLFFLLLSSLNNKKEFTLKDFMSGEYTAYTKNEICDSSIFLGTCYMTKNANVKDEIIGESIKTTNTELAKLLGDLDASVVKTELLDCGAVVISAFSPKIGDAVMLDDKKVNLQIASYTDYSIVGWPVILGSF